MEIHTIGFTQTTAERFFKRLADVGVERLLDVRLNNSSQRQRDASRLLTALRGRLTSNQRRSTTTSTSSAAECEVGLGPCG